jgi:hypothetical protein
MEEGKPTRTLLQRALNEPLDPFAALCTPGLTHASVGFSLGTSQDYGRLKVVATVRVDCNQSTATMDKAAEMAFSKALEYMKDGFSILSGEPR